MKKNIIILSIMLLVLGTFSFAAESGPVKPGPFPTIGKASPVTRSVFFVKDALIKDGKAQVVLPMDTPKGAIALVLGEASVKARTAGQQELEPVWFNDAEYKRLSMPEQNTRFNLDKLSVGKQALNFYNLEGKKHLQMVISQPKSTLVLHTQVTPLAARSGEEVTVTARIADEKLPQAAVVSAALPGQESFFLMDDGLNGDEKAGDGIFTGRFIAPAVNGFKGVNIRFSADGRRFDGSEFCRNGLNSVMVTNPVAKITKPEVTREDNTIVVPVGAVEGNFRVEIIFGFGDMALAYSSEDVNMEGAPMQVRLPLPKEALAADRAMIRLLNKNTLGLEDQLQVSLTPTQAAPGFDAVPKAHVLPASKARAAQMMEEEKDHKDHNH